MPRRALLACLIGLVVTMGCARKAPPAWTPPPDVAAAGSEGRPLTYVQIDVGQGDSGLVVSPDGEAMLVDGGGPGRLDRIQAALKAHGVERLAVVVATHPHNDHIGSLDDVILQVPVGRFLDSGFNLGSDAQQRLLKAIKERRVPFTLARAGESFSLGDQVTVAVLAPRTPLITGTDSDPNNNSVILKVAYGGVRLLLTGDMEERERERLYSDGQDLAAEVYKVAHHGSHNGTDAELLGRVRPRLALISCELGNDYGHPHAKTITALTSASVPIYRTDLQGTLTLTTNGRTWGVRTERAATAAQLTRTGRDLAWGGGERTMRQSGSKGGSARAAPAAGAIVGNRRSKVYHVGGGSRLPSEENRVYFDTEAEAQRAGYRRVGGDDR